MIFIIFTSNHHLAFQLCRFSRFFPTLPSLLHVSNITALSLLMNSVLLHTVLHVIFPNDFVSSEDSPTKLQLLPFLNLLFNSSSFGSQFKYFLLRDISLTLSIQFSSVAQSCPTLCNAMNCSTPGLPVHHQLLESQTHVHRVSDAIQSFHPLSSPSPTAINLSQHQGLFQ